MKTKTFSFALAFFLQLLFLFIILRYLSTISQFISYILTGIGILICIRVFNRDSDSSSKLLWVFLILLVPFFGTVVYLLFGERRIPHQLMITTRVNEQAYIRYGLTNQEIIHRVEDPFLKKMINMSWNSGYFSAYENSYLEYYPTWRSTI